jgi:N-acetylmuramoyl-L-alanine amidase
MDKNANAPVTSPTSSHRRASLSSAVVLAGCLLAAIRGSAQQTQPPALNHNLIFLDPAHGGPDTGARLGDSLLEKDVTLAFAARLRAALVAAGFTVQSTREADGLALLPNDQRADLANRSHAVACIVLHATGSGSGIHLYTSALKPNDAPPPYDPMDDPAPFVPTPWDKAQTGSIRQSLHLAADLGQALGTASLPVMTARATVRPLDSLTCPAVAVEIAPLIDGGTTTPVNDPGYQQRVAEALTRSLLFWRGHADPPSARSIAKPADFSDALPVRTPPVAPGKPKPAPVVPPPVKPPVNPPPALQDPEANP